jgi:dipeptidase E
LALYLASSRLNGSERELAWVGGPRVAVVLNALDNLPEFPRAEWFEDECAALRALGLEPFDLDLRAPLDLDGANLVWAVGGNVFVLREAMRRSGLDQILQAGELDYGGYSAGASVAGSTLRGLELVDDVGAVEEPIWEGLGLVDHAIAPHYRSDHPDAEAIEAVVASFELQGIPYRALRDGEAIVVGAQPPELTVRPARKGDGDALQRIHADMLAHYAEVDPAAFHAPDLTGFAEWVAGELDEREDAVDLVAELDGSIVAALFATIVRPPEGAQWASARDVEAVRVRIEYLATAAGHRRTGAGTALVEAAERWGRERGATVAETTTYRDGPLSIPFWTGRAGYERRSVNLRKAL